MQPITSNSQYPEPENQKVLRVEYPGIINTEGNPVRCILIVEDDNGTPVVEIVPTYPGVPFIDVRCRQIDQAHDALVMERAKMAEMVIEIEELKARLAFITAPPAKLDYSDLVNIAMIQSEGEICGWQNVSLSDSNFYATHKARAETDPQYLAILNSCRSHRRADRDADAMRTRAEKLMDEMKAVMTLDEEIALGLYDDAATEWEARVAQGEIEADEQAARQEEEAGADPTRRFLEEDMIHDHFAEQGAEGQD